MVQPTPVIPGYTLEPVDETPRIPGYKLEPVDVAEDIKKTIDPSLARGFAGVGGAPAFIAELGARGIDKAVQGIGAALGYKPEQLKRPEGSSVAHLPTYEEIMKSYEEKIGGKAYEPVTPTGKLVGAGLEALPGAAIPIGRARYVAEGVGTAARVLAEQLTKFGVLPGLASEAAGQASEGSPYEPYLRVGAGLAAPVAASVVQGTVRGAMAPSQARIQEVLREHLPGGITQQHITDAGQLIEDAARRGINLSWAQALSQVADQPALVNLQRVLEGHASSAPRMTQFYAGQAPTNLTSGAMDRALQHELGAVAPPTGAPTTVGPAIGEAAQQTKQDIKDIINRAADPYYARAIPERFSSYEMAQLRSLPGWNDAVEAIRNHPELARYVQGIPENSPAFANEVMKWLRTQGENFSRREASAPNAQIAGGYKSDAAAVRQIATGLSQPLEQALDIQARGRAYADRFIGPGTHLGALAEKDLTTQNAINALFPREPLANSAREISDAVGALAHRNPEAARQLVRIHIENTFNEASRELQGGSRYGAGANFRVQLMGNPQQAANLEAAVRALPNGDHIWTGFDRFMDIMGATGKRPAVGTHTAFTGQMLEDLAKGPLPMEAARSVTRSPLHAFQFVSDMMGRWQLGHNLDRLADVITDPRSQNLLRAVAATPRDSNRIGPLIARIGQLIAASTQSERRD